MNGDLLNTPRALIDAELKKRAQRDAAVAAIVEKSRPKLREFIRGMWKWVDPKPFLMNWHIDAKCEHLEAVSDGHIDKLIINEPPGYAKSLVCSVGWPAWEWGPAGMPQTRWLVVSFGGTNDAPALRDAGKMRMLIQSQWYQAQWGPLVVMTDDQNEKSFFKNTKHGYRVSAGLDGAISGQRADRILIDDPSKLDADLSLTELMKPQTVWDHVLRTRTIDDGSAVVLIMQRLHEEDLTGYFLKEDGWTHLKLPTFFESEDRCRVFLDSKLFFEDPRTIEGQPLHEKMTKAIADARKQARTRPDLYIGQQQQRPTSAEGTIIKKQWMHRWAGPCVCGQNHELPKHFDQQIITADCAFKDSEDNSWVVFQCWARKEANAYLLGQFRKHMDLPATLTTLLEFCNRYPQTTAKYVEAKANGVGVVQMLKNRVPGLISTDDDEDVLKPFVMGSKEAKLQAVAPYFQAGNIKIAPDGELWDGTIDSTGAEYVHEMTAFPKTRFNDQVDATSLGVWKLLHMFEAHVSAAEIYDNDKQNEGYLAKVFDEAYTAREQGAVTVAHKSGFSWGGGGDSLTRTAYGHE